VSHMDVANHNQTGRLIGRALDRPQGESHGRLESQIVRIDDLDMLIGDAGVRYKVLNLESIPVSDSIYLSI